MDREDRLVLVLSFGISAVVVSVTVAIFLIILSVRMAAAQGCTPPALTAAVAKVRAACGDARIISGYRRGSRIRGTGRLSLHASCSSTRGAVDFTTRDYACAYRVLANWPHGISTDAVRVRHIHLSIGGSERRFVHGGGRRYARNIRRGRGVRVARLNRVRPVAVQVHRPWSEN